MRSLYEMPDNPEITAEALVYQFVWKDDNLPRSEYVCRIREDAMRWEKRGSMVDVMDFYLQRRAEIEVQGFKLISGESRIPRYTYGGFIDPSIRLPKDGHEVVVRVGSSLIATAIYRAGGWQVEHFGSPTGEVTGWIDPAERISE